MMVGYSASQKLFITKIQTASPVQATADTGAHRDDGVVLIKQKIFTRFQTVPPNDINSQAHSSEKTDLLT
jgi:hypothetical protein